MIQPEITYCIRNGTTTALSSYSPDRISQKGKQDFIQNWMTPALPTSIHAPVSMSPALNTKAVDNRKPSKPSKIPVLIARKSDNKGVRLTIQRQGNVKNITPSQFKNRTQWTKQATKTSLRKDKGISDAQRRVPKTSYNDTKEKSPKILRQVPKKGANVSTDDGVPRAVRRCVLDGMKTPWHASVSGPKPHCRLSSHVPKTEFQGRVKSAAPKCRPVINVDKAPGRVLKTSYDYTKAKNYQNTSKILRQVPKNRTTVYTDFGVPPANQRHVIDGMKTQWHASVKEPKAYLRSSKPVSKTKHQGKVKSAAPRCVNVDKVPRKVMKTRDDDKNQKCHQKSPKILRQVPKNWAIVSSDVGVLPAICRPIMYAMKTPRHASVSGPKPHCRLSSHVPKTEFQGRVKSAAPNRPAMNVDKDKSAKGKLSPQKKSKIPLPRPCINNDGRNALPSQPIKRKLQNQTLSKIPMSNRYKNAARKVKGDRGTQPSPVIEVPAPPEAIEFSEKLHRLEQLNWVILPELKRTQDGIDTLHSMAEYCRYGYTQPKPGETLKPDQKISTQVTPSVLVVNRNILQELIFNNWYGDVGRASVIPACDTQGKSDFLGWIGDTRNVDQEPYFNHYTNFPTHPDYQSTWFDPTDEMTPKTSLCTKTGSQSVHKTPLCNLYDL